MQVAIPPKSNPKVVSAVPDTGCAVIPVFAAGVGVDAGVGVGVITGITVAAGVGVGVGTGVGVGVGVGRTIGAVLGCTGVAVAGGGVATGEDVGSGGTGRAELYCAATAELIVNHNTPASRTPFWFIIKITF
jgi:hypothetical protein